jgi:MFS family permease
MGMVWSILAVYATTLGASTAMAAVADLSAAERRIADMAAFQGASSIGIASGPGIGGLAAATWGYGAPFLLQGILSAIAIVLLLSIVPRDSGRAWCRRLPLPPPPICARRCARWRLWHSSPTASSSPVSAQRGS